MSRSNLLTLVTMLSDQGKKHNLLLNSLNPPLQKEIGQMRGKELIQAFETFSHLHNHSLEKLPKKMKRVR